jgi:hypothetical protein
MVTTAAAGAVVASALGAAPPLGPQMHAFEYSPAYTNELICMLCWAQWAAHPAGPPGNIADP